jgi:hypothetical protein
LEGRTYYFIRRSSAPDKSAISYVRVTTPALKLIQLTVIAVKEGLEIQTLLRQLVGGPLWLYRRWSCLGKDLLGFRFGDPRICRGRAYKFALAMESPGSIVLQSSTLSPAVSNLLTLPVLHLSDTRPAGCSQHPKSAPRRLHTQRLRSIFNEDQISPQSSKMRHQPTEA